MRMSGKSMSYDSCCCGRTATGANGGIWNSPWCCGVVGGMGNPLCPGSMYPAVSLVGEIMAGPVGGSDWWW